METERLSRVAERMRKMGIAQTLISAPASLYYLTGKWIYPGERMVALLVNDQGQARLFANRLFALNGAVDVPLTEYDDTQDCVALLAEALQPGKIGIDKDWPSRFTIRLMDARSDLKPVIGSPCVDRTRLYKDARELQWMRESSLKNDASILATIAQLSPGLRKMLRHRRNRTHKFLQEVMGEDKPADAAPEAPAKPKRARVRIAASPVKVGSSKL